MSAFAASLLFEDPTHHHNLDGEPPSLSDLLAQLPPDPTDPSRLPPHPPDSSMDFALDFAHLETGPYKNSPNAWKLTSKTAP